MADKKISALTAAALPLAGTEVLPIVQSGATVKVASNDLTVRNVRANATTGILQVLGPTAATTRVMTVPDANFSAARIDAAQSFTGDQTLSTGNLIMGTSGKGVDFSATPGTGTSELFADYEEGTWTPSVSGNFGGDTGQVYATRVGYYTIVGNTVTCYFNVVFSTKGTMNGGGSGMTGFPYTSKSGSLAIIVATANLVDGVRVTTLTGAAGTGFNFFPFSPANITNTSSFEGTVTYQI
jgi:hypothetical protein